MYRLILWINKIDRPADLNVTVGSYNEVYDAQAHTITVSGTTTGDKVEYSYDGGATWSDTLKQYTNVAETPAQIVVRVTNPNYVGEATATGSVIIRPFELTMKANDASKICRIPGSGTDGNRSTGGRNRKTGYSGDYLQCKSWRPGRCRNLYRQQSS